MEYIVVILIAVAAIAISTAYYLYELAALLRHQENRITTLLGELKSVKMTLDIYVRGRNLEEGQNQTPRPNKKTAPKTLNQRRKDNQ